MRDTFIKELTKLANEDESVFLVIGDLGYGVIDEFKEKFPDRFLNAGISEQSMMGTAAGLARSGFKVFVYSIANFPTFRCLEQIRNDVCYHNLDVTVVSIGAGFGYGSLGYSHFAVEDLAVMRVLQRMRVFSPGDSTEISQVLTSILKNGGPTYLRIGKNGEGELFGNSLESPFLPRIISNGSRYLVLSTGNIGVEVCKAFTCLTPAVKDAIEHLSISTLDYKVLDKIDFQRFHKIVTVEEHITLGGFGSFVLEYMSDKTINVPLKRVGVNPDFDWPIGSQDFIRSRAGLDHLSLQKAFVNYFQ